MALAPGARLGVYEIGSQIGAGGMGEVYRAIDTNLKRAVAIKVLPDALAADIERLGRLQREAEVLASLNHRHSCGGVRARGIEILDDDPDPCANHRRIRGRRRLRTTIVAAEAPYGS